MAATIALMGTDYFREGLSFLIDLFYSIWCLVPYPLQAVLIIYFCCSTIAKLFRMLREGVVEK
jgi:hypothetical protein